MIIIFNDYKNHLMMIRKFFAKVHFILKTTKKFFKGTSKNPVCNAPVIAGMTRNLLKPRRC